MPYDHLSGNFDGALFSPLSSRAALSRAFSSISAASCPEDFRSLVIIYGAAISCASKENLIVIRLPGSSYIFHV